MKKVLSASRKSFCTSCHPLRSSSPDSLFPPRPRTPVDTPVQPPLSRQDEAGRRSSSIQPSFLLSSPPICLLVSIQLKPVALGDFKRRRSKMKKASCPLRFGSHCAMLSKDSKQGRREPRNLLSLSLFFTSLAMFALKFRTKK